MFRIRITETIRRYRYLPVFLSWAFFSSSSPLLQSLLVNIVSGFLELFGACTFYLVTSFVAVKLILFFFFGTISSRMFFLKQRSRSESVFNVYESETVLTVKLLSTGKKNKLSLLSILLTNLLMKMRIHVHGSGVISPQLFTALIVNLFYQ